MQHAANREADRPRKTDFSPDRIRKRNPDRTRRIRRSVRRRRFARAEVYLGRRKADSEGRKENQRSKSER